MLHQQIEQESGAHEDWSLRRQKGIPNNRRLWVLACMDERLPIEEALGIEEGDAHVFRNAGGLVTDDAIRSAMLTCNFFGTTEIVVVNHTECGMMTADGEQLSRALQDKGINPNETSIDPSLPELKLDSGGFARWIRMFDDVDEACIKQVEYLRNTPLIPDDVTISGYVWEVESRRLRQPHRRISEKVNTAEAMASGK
ncbi:hypothetical protein BH24ACT22_BH24ACT22_08870 [soil metagenome]